MERFIDANNSPCLGSSQTSFCYSVCWFCSLYRFPRIPIVSVSLALGIAKTPSLINLFVLGLVAGSLAFGGAYTAIHFIQVEAVLKGAWLSQSIFIDCIAIGIVLPALLVIFATFVGFQGGLADGGLGKAFGGAIFIILGILFPCFFFTIAGHSLLEKVVRNNVCFILTCFPFPANTTRLLAAFFDGICGSVVGIIAIVGSSDPKVEH